MNMQGFKDRAKRLYQKAGKELKAGVQKSSGIEDVRKDIKRLERKIDLVLSALRKRP